MNVSIEVIEILFTNHSFIIYLFTFHLFIYLFTFHSFIYYLFIYFLWHFSGTHVRTCVQVATPLNSVLVQSDVALAASILIARSLSIY